jgi:hypothetical protein
MMEVMVVMVHELLPVIILRNGTNGESNRVVSDEMKHQH